MRSNIYFPVDHSYEFHLVFVLETCKAGRSIISTFCCKLDDGWMGGGKGVQAGGGAVNRPCSFLIFFFNTLQR